jgi:hypothetical protein
MTRGDKPAGTRARYNAEAYRIAAVEVDTSTGRAAIKGSRTYPIKHETNNQENYDSGSIEIGK